MTAYNELVRRLNDDMLPLIHDVEAVMSDQRREIELLLRERVHLRKSLLSALAELHHHFGCDADCEKRHPKEEQ